jgi:hypothetical protein
MIKPENVKDSWIAIIRNYSRFASARAIRRAQEMPLARAV